MGGTLTKSHLVVTAASTPALWVGRNVVVTVRGDSPSTLLGPEATGRLVSRLLVPSGVVWGGGWVPSVSGGHGSLGRTQTSRQVRCWCVRDAWWVRPLLENCIVDASIFEFFQDRSR